MKTLAICSLALLLSACGSDNTQTNTTTRESNTNTTSETDDSFTINSFAITGPDGSTDPASIDPAINNGTFVIDLSVSDSRLYSAEIFVSANNTLSEFDISVGGGTCSATDDECNDGTTTDECRFTNNNTIICNPDDTEGYDISSILDELPKDAFIIIKSCNASDLNCDTASSPVTFR
jgi:hypothetical protein